jgi:hypothetical protein
MPIQPTVQGSHFATELFMSDMLAPMPRTYSICGRPQAGQYRTFVKNLTPVAGESPTLGVQGTKLVVAWVDGNNAINMAYWNGEPTDNGFDWQDVLMRQIPGRPDQPVAGTRPLMSQSGAGLLLSWQDTHGVSARLSLRCHRWSLGR